MKLIELTRTEGSLLILNINNISAIISQGSYTEIQYTRLGMNIVYYSVKESYNEIKLMLQNNNLLIIKEI